MFGEQRDPEDLFAPGLFRAPLPPRRAPPPRGNPIGLRGLPIQRGGRQHRALLDGTRGGGPHVEMDDGRLVPLPEGTVLSPSGNFIRRGGEQFEGLLAGTRGGGPHRLVENRLVPLNPGAVAFRPRELLAQVGRLPAANMELLEIVRAFGDRAVSLAVRLPEPVPSSEVEADDILVPLVEGVGPRLPVESTIVLAANYDYMLENQAGNRFPRATPGLRNFRFFTGQDPSAALQLALELELDRQVAAINNLQFEGEFDYRGELFRISVIYFVDDRAGGCRNREKVEKKRGNMILVSPKSANNDCVFAAVKLGLPAEHPMLSVYAKTLRRDLGWAPGTPVSVAQLQPLADLAGVTLSVFAPDGDLLHAFAPVPGAALKGWEAPEDSPGVGLLLMEDHWHFVRDLDNGVVPCPRCGREMRRKYLESGAHVCNPDGMSYRARAQGQPVVQTSKRLIHEEAPSLEGVLFFDLETFPDTSDGADYDTAPHKAYAAGWGKHGEQPSVAAGPDCLLALISAILDDESVRVCVSYNGAGFDHHFLIRLLAEQGYEVERPADAGGRLLSFSVRKRMPPAVREEVEGARLRIKRAKRARKGELRAALEALRAPYRPVVFFDLCAHMAPGTSLRAVARDLRVPTQKGDFDHFSVRSFADAERLRPLWEPYLHGDVLALSQVFAGYQTAIWEACPGIHLTDHPTSAALTYAVWSNLAAILSRQRLGQAGVEERQPLPEGVAQDVYIPREENYDFIRSSVFGGRCHPFQPDFVSGAFPVADALRQEFEQAAEAAKPAVRARLRELYDQIPWDDCAVYADVTSLYPASMERYHYPTGPEREMTAEEVAAVSEIGRRGAPAELPPSVLLVRILHAPRHLRVAVLPSRKPGGGISWTHEFEGLQTYTSVDLENALRHGYAFEVVRGIQWDKTAPVFQPFVLNFYRLKALAEEAGNEALRTAAKLLLNALYGKMIQRPVEVRTKFARSARSALKFADEHTILSWSVPEGGEGPIILRGSPTGVSRGALNKKPTHLGSFILAYSRRIMLDALETASPGLGTIDGLHYTDTDSLITNGRNLAAFREAGLVEPAGLGKLSDDTKARGGWGKILWFRALGPKNYSLVWLTPDGTLQEKCKCKGIPSPFLDRRLYEPGHLSEEDRLELQETTRSRLIENGRLPAGHTGELLTSDKRVTMRGMKRLGWRGDYGGVRNHTQTRTFGKTAWRGMELRPHEGGFVPWGTL